METPLEALNILVGMAVVQQRAYEIKPIIENALKRLDMYENVVGIERIQDTNKKLKALEIIKEKIAPLVCLDDGEISKGRYRVYDNEFYGFKELTKEEYELLKEVLL